MPSFKTLMTVPLMTIELFRVGSGVGSAVIVGSGVGDDLSSGCGKSEPKMPKIKRKPKPIAARLKQPIPANRQPLFAKGELLGGGGGARGAGGGGKGGGSVIWDCGREAAILLRTA